MILQKEIFQHRNKFGVPPTTIDKDWVLGHFLNAMYSFSEISENFIFKGGTCLKKCYFTNYRFSEDLDFTLLDNTFSVGKKLINKIINTVEINSGAKFHLNFIKPQIHKDVEQGYEVEIKFWGADHKPNQKLLLPSRWQTKIKLDVSFSEKLILAPVNKTITHPYSDKEQIINSIPVYSIYEIVAEKLRSLVQRNRPRDVYDNWYFSKNIDKQDYLKIKKLLIQKAENKFVDISNVENFVNEQKYKLNKRAWESSLIHQISAEQLPYFDDAYNRLYLFIEKILNS